MKILTAIFLMLGASTLVFAPGGGTAPDAASPGNADGILQSIENANVTHSGQELLVTRRDPGAPVEIVFTTCQGLGVQHEANQWWVLPISTTGAHIDTNSALWVLPLDAASKDRSWYLAMRGGNLSAEKTES